MGAKEISKLFQENKIPQALQSFNLFFEEQVEDLDKYYMEQADKNLFLSACGICEKVQNDKVFIDSQSAAFKNHYITTIGKFFKLLKEVKKITKENNFSINEEVRNFVTKTT